MNQNELMLTRNFIILAVVYLIIYKATNFTSNKLQSEWMHEGYVSATLLLTIWSF